MPTVTPSSTRPHAGRLAFVLGSGGVRSIAALGIASRLAREGIRPDLVVGCSSGALFGAQIARGMHGEEAMRLATTLWSEELTQQRRWRAYLQLIAPKLAGFSSGFALRDDRLIAERITNAFGDVQLEQLPTPLRVAATDAATGEPVVLTQGRLVDALRASMAVPIIFPSVCIGGRHLVDGVLSDPLPIAAAADSRVVLSALTSISTWPAPSRRSTRVCPEVSVSKVRVSLMVSTAMFRETKLRWVKWAMIKAPGVKKVAVSLRRNGRRASIKDAQARCGSCRRNGQEAAHGR